MKTQGSVFTAGAIMLASLGSTVQAGEGAGSHYVPGTRNDFLMGVFGPPGTYLRYDLYQLDMSVNTPHALAGRVVGAATQKAALNTFKLSHLSDIQILGGRYGASLAATYVFDAAISGSAVIGGAPFTAQGSGSGLADLYVVPIMLNWKAGNNNFTFAPAVYAPTGGYDVNNLINTGRNYWSIDVVGNYTWFDPASGWEFSAGGGILYNFENPDTEYQTGTEFHLDWIVAKHFPNGFAAGLSGYVYNQLNSDSGPVTAGLDPSTIKADSWGLGPSIQFTIPAGKTSFNLIAKALFDIESSQRFSGDVYMISATYKF